ncbi:MAG: hypothetical protein O3A13_04720 [Proteobacteria bacterium]|nr:hypothetical protein [Pseudomonadota bacterium]MDA0992916.1 hypothetical protein [Pseudomonadota bacterium]
MQIISSSHFGREAMWHNAGSGTYGCDYWFAISWQIRQIAWARAISVLMAFDIKDQISRQAGEALACTGFVHLPLPSVPQSTPVTGVS